MIEFYIIGDNNMYQGPYSKDELRSKGINSDTLVWCTGMRSWKKASEVPEVEDLLLPQPPALTQQGYSSQSQSHMQEPQEEYVSLHDRANLSTTHSSGANNWSAITQKGWWKRKFNKLLLGHCYRHHDSDYRRLCQELRFSRWK